MTKNEKTLFDLLESKGRKVKSVWYYPTFGCQPGGWTASIIEEDEDGDECEVDYDLGRDFIEAKGQIQNDEITRCA